MTPEEALYYEYTDCEDRSALFYYLVKELLDLPMVILKYPNHVNIAVKIDNVPGQSVIYEGNKYYVCEPSNTRDNTDVGFSEKLQKYRPEIIDPKK